MQHRDSFGHKSTIHAVTGFQQRRVIVESMVGTFHGWFYESVFRSWWQLNGCGGVPLYKLYRRKTDWRTDVQPIIGECNDEMSDFGRSLARPQQPDTKNYSLSKTDSLEELMKTVRAPRTPADHPQYRMIPTVPIDARALEEIFWLPDQEELVPE
ncbi:hypothetical protein TCAL_14443 [Tigriopus californicus]|uniref:Uncharacterized protein n=1 Tax=Tigriopus californicus TaxID=6832 RepID=A0A553PKN0_TIGCA|nr:hypothetical protein TCAL_14443 [Tigriopus californicus]